MRKKLIDDFPAFSKRHCVQQRSSVNRLDFKKIVAIIKLNHRIFINQNCQARHKS